MAEDRRHDIDEHGEETLRVVGRADRFNHWMYDTIRPYCSGKILEIGSGVGNISRYFLHDGARLVLSDLRRHYCDKLRERFQGFDNLVGVENIDLVHERFDTRYAELVGTFDTVFALNVIEHIEDDRRAIGNCGKLLAKGGTLIVLVPAFQSLYNVLDARLAHYRRYNRRTLRAVLDADGLTLRSTRYFNLAGIPGWFFSGRFRGNELIPDSQMQLFNRLVPLFRLVDKAAFNRVGLSVIGVCDKG